MPTTLTIPKHDQYEFEGLKLFMFRSNDGDKTVLYRDVHVDLCKDRMPDLRSLAREVNIHGFMKMRKADLIKELNKYVIFE